MTTDDAIKKWAELLEWPTPVRHVHRIVEGHHGRNAAGEIVWFLAGSYDTIALQINMNPTWHAAVYAIRYRICTGWHALHLDRRANGVAAEANRLDEWLHRRWFETREGRKEFRVRHPECAGYTWRRIREEGPPYGYSD